MSKSVYSVVLMDDVVDAVDRLAYEAGTNRSNMINRILAEYVQLATPEQRMQDIFSSIMDAVSGQNALQLMLNASDAMLSMRSAIHYKYNPSMRYVVELYPHSTEELGEVRAGLRTQNPSLLLYIGLAFKKGMHPLVNVSICAVVGAIMVKQPLNGLGAVIYESMGSFLALVGFIIMLGSGLGMGLRKTGVAAAIVNALLYGMGKR